MRQVKNGFRHDSLQDAHSIRAILVEVADGIGKGKILFSDEDDEIVLQPRGLLQLRLKAEQEESRRQISIRISWQADDNRAQTNSSLTVSS